MNRIAEFLAQAILAVFLIGTTLTIADTALPPGSLLKQPQRVVVLEIGRDPAA